MKEQGDFLWQCNQLVEIFRFCGILSGERNFDYLYNIVFTLWNTYIYNRRYHRRDEEQIRPTRLFKKYMNKHIVKRVSSSRFIIMFQNIHKTVVYFENSNDIYLSLRELICPLHNRTGIIFNAMKGVETCVVWCLVIIQQRNFYVK